MKQEFFELVGSLPYPHMFQLAHAEGMATSVSRWGDRMGLLTRSQSNRMGLKAVLRENKLGGDDPETGKEFSYSKALVLERNYGTDGTKQRARSCSN